MKKSNHAKICLEARAKIKERDTQKLTTWVNTHEPMSFEVFNGRSVYFTLKKISYLAGVKFSTVGRYLSSSNDKWKQYRIKNWSPKLSTLQELMIAFNITLIIRRDQ